MNEKEIKEKLKAYAEILDSLYTSGIVRTYNSPVGDYTEWLVSNKLGLELQNNSAAGFDALDKENRVTLPNKRALGKSEKQKETIKCYP